MNAKPMTLPKDASEPDREAAYFEKKATWKVLHGNHYRPGEKTPMDGLQLVTKPEPAGLVLDWA